MRSRGRKKNGLFVVHDLLVYVPVAAVVFRTELDVKMIINIYLNYYYQNPFIINSYKK